MDNDKSESNRSLGVLLFFLLTPLFYFLSVGPAAVLYNSGGPNTRRAVEIVYKPLEITCKRFDWVEKAVESYVDLWL